MQAPVGYRLRKSQFVWTILSSLIPKLEVWFNPPKKGIFVPFINRYTGNSFVSGAKATITFGSFMSILCLGITSQRVRTRNWAFSLFVSLCMRLEEMSMREPLTGQAQLQPGGILGVCCEQSSIEAGSQRSGPNQNPETITRDTARVRRESLFICYVIVIHSPLARNLQQECNSAVGLALIHPSYCMARRFAVSSLQILMGADQLTKVSKIHTTCQLQSYYVLVCALTSPPPPQLTTLRTGPRRDSIEQSNAPQITGLFAAQASSLRKLSLANLWPEVQVLYRNKPKEGHTVV